MCGCVQEQSKKFEPVVRAKVDGVRTERVMEQAAGKVPCFWCCTFDHTRSGHERTPLFDGWRQVVLS